MDCEICGNQITGQSQRVIIEGAKMMTCKKCANLGSEYWEPESRRLVSPLKINQKRLSKNVSITRKKQPYISEELVVTESFGLLIRQSRERRGLSHKDLGRKIGEKVSLIKKIENGKIIPNNRLAVKLENLLGIKLLIPLIEPKVSSSSSQTRKGIILGDIAHFKNLRRKKDESNHS